MPTEVSGSGGPGTSVSAGGTSRHSQLLGLSADDHPQYVLADGSRAITATQTFNDGLKLAGGSIHADSQVLLQGQRDGTQRSVVIQRVADADAGNTVRNSNRLILRGAYWNGSASVAKDAVIEEYVDETTGKSRLVSDTSIEVQFTGALGIHPFGYKHNATLSSAPDAAPVGAGFDSLLEYRATDTTDPLLNKYHGIKQTVNYGQSGGAAATGTVHAFTGQVSVRNSASSRNEHGGYVGFLVYETGADPTNGRAWLTDLNLHGPVGGQLNSANGVTAFVNNYYNGAMGANGLSSVFAAVTKPGTGGGATASHAAATTYKLGAGLLVTGYAGTTGAKTRGFDYGVQIGGTGGHWNNANDSFGDPSATADSIIGTGVFVRDVEDNAFLADAPQSGSPVVLKVGATGTWSSFIDFTAAAAPGSGDAIKMKGRLEMNGWRVMGIGGDSGTRVVNVSGNDPSTKRTFTITGVTVPTAGTPITETGLRVTSRYWDGAAAQTKDVDIVHRITSPSGTQSLGVEFAGSGTDVLTLTSAGLLTAAGGFNAGSQRIQSVAAPTASTDAATKSYVDSAIQGLDWQESVKDRDLSTPPGAPSTGDRYIIAATATGDWAGHEEKIAEWNGSAWDISTPTEGAAVWLEDENLLVTYNDAHPAGSWVTFGSTVDHGALSGLTDDDHTQYVHISTARTITAAHTWNAHQTFGDAYQIKWSDAALKRESASVLSVRNAADSADGSLVALSLIASSSFQGRSGTSPTFRARDTGGPDTLVTVAQLTRAATPYLDLIQARLAGNLVADGAGTRSIGDATNYLAGVTSAQFTVRNTGAGGNVAITANSASATISIAGGVSITGANWLTFAAGGAISTDTSTGTKIATATTQKLGFWNATPAAQPAAVSDASGGAVIDSEARTAINALLSRLRTIGIIAT